MLVTNALAYYLYKNRLNPSEPYQLRRLILALLLTNTLAYYFKLFIIQKGFMLVGLTHK